MGIGVYRRAKAAPLIENPVTTIQSLSGIPKRSDGPVIRMLKEFIIPQVKISHDLSV